MDEQQITTTVSAKTPRLRFGLFEVELDQRILTKRGARVRLQDQPFQILALLLQRPGQLVTREELRQKLWTDGTFVEFDDGLNTAVKKLRTALGDSADNPRFIETVPRQGYRFLAPVITEPVIEQAKAETRQETAPPELMVATRERSSVLIERSSARSSWLWTAGALTVALAAALGGYFYRARHTSNSATEKANAAATASTIKARPSIAVMGFRNLSRTPEDAWLSTALSEMLNTELAAGERLRMVPGEEISRSKLDLSLLDTEALAKESLDRVRVNLGADYVVLGSYAAVGEKGKKRIRLDLRLQDTRAGETVDEEAVEGSQQDLFDLISEAGTRLRQRLQAGSLGAEDSVRVRASMPSSVQAARLYAEGLSKLRVFDAVSASDLLQKAVAEDPSFSMAHSALASAWTALGYESKARQEAKLAFDLSGQLSPEEKMLSEARYREANREWPRAIEIYSNLWKTFPDNVDYGLRLAWVQASAGHPDDSLGTLGSLRGSASVANDLRVELEESRTAEMMGDFRRSQQAASRAATRGISQGARLIVAQARSDEGWDWDRLGEFDKATDALVDARDLFTTAGDHRSAALATNMMGDVLYDKGDYENALKTLNQSLEMCRQYGFQGCAARSLNAIGNIQNDRGQVSQARASYGQVLRINSELGIRQGVGAALSNIANTFQEQGQLQDARKSQEESLKVYTEIGDKRGMAATLGNLGNLLDDMGELSAAVQCFEKAYKLDEETGYKRGFGFVLTGWGNVLLEQGQFAESRSKLDEALRIRRELGSPGMIGSSLLSLARLELEQEKFAESERLARDAAAEFVKVKENDDEASADAVLAHSLLDQHKAPEARSAVERALSLKSSGLQQQFETGIAGAELNAAMGKTVEAQKDLDKAILRARQLNFERFEFAARLERCKLMIAAGQTGAGMSQLQSLEHDARAKGFLLIAQQSAAALRK